MPVENDIAVGLVLLEVIVALMQVVDHNTDNWEENKLATEEVTSNLPLFWGIP